MKSSRRLLVILLVTVATCGCQDRELTDESATDTGPLHDSGVFDSGDQDGLPQDLNAALDSTPVTDSQVDELDPADFAGSDTVDVALADPDAADPDAADLTNGDAADLADGDTALPAFPVFAGVWGGRGTEPGEFIEPSSVEIDSEGVVIVAGHEDRVQRFTLDGELIDIFGEGGTGDGQFDHPHGLAVDRQRGDLIYVGDQENHRLQVFTREGAFVRTWGDAQFSHIHDVGIDQETGTLFVGDYELDTVRIFDPTGELLAEFGGSGTEPGRFDGVWGISTDSSGDVYIADTFNQRIQKLDGEGTFLMEWGGYAEEPFLKPTGVFVDHLDLVYVCDSLAQAVYVFDAQGTALQRWDLGTIYGAESEPEDIVIDPTGTHIFIAEVFGHRVIHLTRP